MPAPSSALGPLICLLGAPSRPAARGLRRGGAHLVRVRRRRGRLLLACEGEQATGCRGGELVIAGPDRVQDEPVPRQSLASPAFSRSDRMDPGEKRRFDDGLQLGDEFVPACVEHGSVEAPIGLSEVFGVADRRSSPWP